MQSCTEHLYIHCRLGLNLSIHTLAQSADLTFTLDHVFHPVSLHLHSNPRENYPTSIGRILRHLSFSHFLHSLKFLKFIHQSYWNWYDTVCTYAQQDRDHSKVWKVGEKIKRGKLMIEDGCGVRVHFWWPQIVLPSPIQLLFCITIILHHTHARARARIHICIYKLPIFLNCNYNYGGRITRYGPILHGPEKGIFLSQHIGHEKGRKNNFFFPPREARRHHRA